MKKLYRKGTVHPSPPIISDQLAFLPATILTLAAALSPEDREVLAYLISCSNSSINLSSSSSSSSSYGSRKSTAASAAKKGAAKGSGSGGDHPARFNCDCFRCYKSYWVRWDESPNRQLIHEIIDAFEDGLLAESKGQANSKYNNNNSRKERRNKRGHNGGSSGELKRSELSLKKKELAQAHMADQETGGGGGGGEVDEEDSEKGSVRRFVSFVGERIWGVWSQ
ncbi:unnamed protein product [Prunus armeniaca]|uniref:Uncharacterized protein n=1 Tax=Prunus armeniaca TaxID=36596 RepID=A0A6J5UNM3_PRUAR|nr:hypothetical protein GBA52_013139 [Prunus armeniaca]CAB4275688.1 unnamed protein product [Prunus armeniaca]